MAARGMLIHFKLDRPRDHWREASCAEVGCVNYAAGWRTILPVDDLANIGLIRKSRMGFREEGGGDGLIIFIFSPGQECFTGQGGGHRVALERDPVLTKDKRIMEPLEFMDNWNDHFYRRSVR